MSSAFSMVYLPYQIKEHVEWLKSKEPAYDKKLDLWYFTPAMDLDASYVLTGGVFDKLRGWTNAPYGRGYKTRTEAMERLKAANLRHLRTEFKKLENML